MHDRTVNANSQSYYAVSFMPAYSRITRYARAIPKAIQMPPIETLFIMYLRFSHLISVYALLLLYINIIILKDMIIIMIMIHTLRQVMARHQ